MVVALTAPGVLFKHRILPAWLPAVGKPEAETTQISPITSEELQVKFSSDSEEIFLKYWKEW
jgi:hypothetical protein